MSILISFPTLVSSILVSQRPEILISEEVMGVSGSPLTFSYRLFSGSHVPDMSIPNIYFNMTIESDISQIP